MTNFFNTNYVLLKIKSRKNPKKDKRRVKKLTYDYPSNVDY